MPDSGSHHVWRKIDFVVLLIPQNKGFFCQCPVMVLDRKDFPGVGRILRRVLRTPLRVRGAWWIADTLLLYTGFQEDVWINAVNECHYKRLNDDVISLTIFGGAAEETDLRVRQKAW
jgi:hypothetical protein